MEAVTYIVAAGDFYEDHIKISEEDLLIAVDGGYDHLRSLGMKPDYVVGDMDSILKDNVSEACMRLCKEKDETDTYHGIVYARQQGYKKVVVYGATGGKRISHTIANIQLLEHFKDLQLYLVDKEECVFALTEGRREFCEECKGYVSIFSVTNQCDGVNLEGLKYPLRNAQLTSAFPLGVSNEFLGKKSSISVDKGMLLVAMDKKNLKYLL